MVRKSPNGFTIIEVLIVMAIVGLILMIVFLAVPALRRTDRNSRRRRDAAFIASQRLQYNIDTQTAMIPGGFNCSPPLTSKLFCNYIKSSLGYYDMSNVNFHNSGLTPPTSVPTITDPDQILTDTYYECNPDGTAFVSTAARSMVVLFAIETGSGFKQQCTASGVVPTS